MNLVGNVPESIMLGLEEFTAKHGLSEMDYTIHVEPGEENRWELIFSEGAWRLRINRWVQLFRALCCIKEKGLPEERASLHENCVFHSLGISIDVSQSNAVLLPKTIKDLLLYMAAMGIDRLLLYSEDSYPLDQYPCFGYMRGQYTKDELVQIDQYAYNLGIEVVPCIQTLAHLSNPLRWMPFKRFAEDETTLLVGDPQTYRFIEQMIAAAAQTFHSRRIHIGMDEAWRLGQCNYLKLNGYRPKAEILCEHLSHVMEIVRRYGLKPMMWSDMFFRSQTSLSDEEYQIPENGQMPESIKNSIPPDIELVYWEYIRTEEDVEKRIALHQQLTGKLTVAGHIRNNRSVGANYGLTFRASRDMINACVKSGVSDILATVWGDNAPESNIYGTLLGMQLFAEYQYGGQVDTDTLRSRFSACVGAEANDFYALTYFDEIPAIHGEKGNQKAHNPSRWLLWQDPLLGLFDSNIAGLDMRGHYTLQAERMRQAALRNKSFFWLFDYYEKAARALAEKSMLGCMLHEAYKKQDKGMLAKITDSDIPRARAAITQMYEAHRSIWLKNCKPEGWEVFDIRYGGLLARLDTVRLRVISYLNGELDEIEELTHTQLPYNNMEDLVLEPYYTHMVTAGNL